MRIAKPLLQLAFIGLVTAGLGEAALRLFFDATEAYPYNDVLISSTETHFRLQFEETYDGKPLPGGVLDTDLGWDYNQHNQGIRPPPKKPGTARAPGIRRIAFIGDSFVHGNEVDNDQTFAHLIATRCANTESLNFGVGGYGIDQIAMKFDLRVLPYKPDVVVFGIHPADYSRSALSFFTYAKPVYRRLDDGSFVTAGVPVPPFQQQLDMIKNDPWPKLYIWGALQAIVARLPILRDYFMARYLDYADAVNGHAIDVVLEGARKIGAPVIAVIIPDGAFTVEETRTDYLESHPYRRTLALLADRDVKTIDLANVFEATADLETIRDTFYFRRESGFFGHMTPLGHAVTADVLQPLVCD